MYNFSSINYRNDKISIDTNLLNSQKENSPLDYIWISDKRSHVGNNHRIKILFPTIKIISNSKEYILNTNPNSEVISVYKQGVIITDDFKAYIGKVQLDDGTIIDIPPLSFKKTVYVERYSVISDTINAGGRGKEIFSGTVEDYKKQKK
ncbi:hypothetical protein [Fusobacterium periodonticum]|uniref:Uncharacterized protein n=1 Tax=Fusobacterium periodonticum D10 TaxID=620833 RepID=K1GK94_9FUSO|nr:hypothetical protein [Fusobacterium periodonticum]EKA93725.1 hypothetical protein FPOG_01535 [Fusobacterium periodonticum D10]